MQILQGAGILAEAQHEWPHSPHRRRSRRRRQCSDPRRRDLRDCGEGVVFLGPTSAHKPLRHLSREVAQGQQGRVMPDDVLTAEEIHARTAAWKAANPLPVAVVDKKRPPTEWWTEMRTRIEELEILARDLTTR